MSHRLREYLLRRCKVKQLIKVFALSACSIALQAQARAIGVSYPSMTSLIELEVLSSAPRARALRLLDVDSSVRSVAEADGISTVHARTILDRLPRVAATGRQRSGDLRSYGRDTTVIRLMGWNEYRPNHGAIQFHEISRRGATSPVVRVRCIVYVERTADRRWRVDSAQTGGAHGYLCSSH